MELIGNVVIHAPRATVWRALNDPDMLASSIPGCEEVREVSAVEFLVRVAVKLGPVRARFVGKIVKSEIREDQGFHLEFEGSGGSAGFANGHSEVNLADCEEGTLLSYSSSATVGGKLGQIGGRLIDVSARHMADHFFRSLGRRLDSRAKVSGQSEVDKLAIQDASSPAPLVSGGAQSVPEMTRLIWFGMGVASTALGVLLGAALLR